MGSVGRSVAKGALGCQVSGFVSEVLPVGAWVTSVAQRPPLVPTRFHSLFSLPVHHLLVLSFPSTTSLVYLHSLTTFFTMKVLSILSIFALAGAAAAASHPIAHPRKHHINRASTGQTKAARCAAVKKAADLAAQSSASVQSTQSVESTHSVHSVEATHTTHHDPAPTKDSSDDNSDSGGNGGGGDRFGGDLTFYEMGAVRTLTPFFHRG